MKTISGDMQKNGEWRWWMNYGACCTQRGFQHPENDGQIRWERDAWIIRLAQEVQKLKRRESRMLWRYRESIPGCITILLNSSAFVVSAMWIPVNTCLLMAQKQTGSNVFYTTFTTGSIHSAISPARTKIT